MAIRTTPAQRASPAANASTRPVKRTDEPGRANTARPFSTSPGGSQPSMQSMVAMTIPYGQSPNPMASSIRNDQQDPHPADDNTTQGSLLDALFRPGPGEDQKSILDRMLEAFEIQGVEPIKELQGLEIARRKRNEDIQRLIDFRALPAGAGQYMFDNTPAALSEVRAARESQIDTGTGATEDGFMDGITKMIMGIF